MNLHFSDLVIEVTRRCNFEYAHCLRGDAQNIDLDIRYISYLFSHTISIGTIIFTGGEPQLVPNIITGIRRLAESYDVSIGNFYVATNGSINSEEFLFEMMEWWLFCDDNEVSKVEMSADPYHQEVEYVKPEELYINTLKFFRVRDKNKGYAEKEYIREGRFSDRKKARELNSSKEIDYEIDGQTIYFDETVYLNCLGQLVSDCDLSYARQSDFVIGTCTDGLKLFLEG